MGKPKILMNLEGSCKGWVSKKEYTLPHLRVNYSSYLFSMVCDKTAFLGSSHLPKEWALVISFTCVTGMLDNHLGQIFKSFDQ